ncbi:hypothetical protein BH09VER1_BH09VER1_20380 [soil metagenome]
MDAVPRARVCHLREEIDRAIIGSRGINAGRGLQCKTVLDPRLPSSVCCDPATLTLGLGELIATATQSIQRNALTLIVYEMDDTSRSVLRFEIEGTKLGFTLALDATAPLHEVENSELLILVAEDNAVNQQMAVECLRSLHQECRVVDDGRAAVEASAKTAYDVIFMDVHMPVMDGLEATRQIRKLPKGNRPYIAALTAYALPGDKARCLEAGMNDYIAKPCRAQNLARILEKVQQAPGGRAD